MAAPITRNLTILLTDIKGFTDKSSHKTRAEIQQMLDKHKEIVLPILEGKGGKLIKTIGDAFLMTFESPTDAVLAGVQVQEALRAYNVDKDADLVIEIRVAINQGEVNLIDNDVYGEPVNITARIEAIAEANEVFFTDAVYLAMNKKEVPSSEVGLLQLKGIPEKVRVYKVKRENPVAGETDGTPSGPVSTSRRFWNAVKPVVGPVAGPGASRLATPGARPKIFRRVAAVAIDLCFCGILVSTFWPGETTDVHIKRSARHRKEEAAIAAAVSDAEKSPSQFQMDCKSDLTRFCADVKPEEGASMISCVRAHSAKLSAACTANSLVKGGEAGAALGKNGLTVHGPDANVKFGSDGLDVKSPKADVQIGKDGVKVNNKKVNFNIGLDGVNVEDDSKEDKVYDDDGWTVSTIKKSKDLRMTIALFVYCLIFVKRMGTTPGGKICKLAVVSHPSGAPLDKNQNMMRALFSAISYKIMLLGFIWGLWEKDGRGWHDLMAGTRVVSVE
jgi:class 3 adenylate cyclase